MIPLDRNESYWLLDDALASAFLASGQKELSTYPDYAQLKQELAGYAGVNVDQICLTPGSDMAIEVFANAFVGKDGEAVLPVPTFYGYESILDRVGAVTIPVCYTEIDGSFSFPIQKTLEVIEQPSVKALFLCHPNNPLACNIPENDLQSMIESTKKSGVLLVSDEAYFEFSGKTLLPLLADMPNLVIIRTLSKGFGLSGARVGYCIAAPEIIKKMESLMLPWPITNQSVFAARAALSKTGEVRERLTAVIQQREKFIEALKQIEGVTIYPSETNFALIRVPSAEETAKKLLEAGVKVALGKNMSHFPEAQILLSNTLRVAIPSPEDTAKVLAALQPTH